MTTYSLSGQCKDISNSGVGFAVVHAFLTADDTEQAETTANASGHYTFTGLSDPGPYYLVAYHANSPDIAGTTLNTLMGVVESLDDDDYAAWMQAA